LPTIIFGLIISYHLMLFSNCFLITFVVSGIIDIIISMIKLKSCLFIWNYQSLLMSNHGSILLIVP